jgi:aspartate/methionine/tyrosine aminotransferase
LDPAGSPIAALDRTSVEADGLFDAPTYSEWARRTMQAGTPAADATVLFDNTITEPTEELVEVVRGAFGSKLTDRFVSVFDGGNPFVISALSRRYGVEAEQIIPTTGACSAMALALRTLTAPGDHVLVEQPGFDQMSVLARDAGVVVNTLPRSGDGYRIDPDVLRAKLTPRTRLVMITNLHNPSGMLLTPPELRRLAAVADEHGAVLLVDEVYADFAGAAPAAKLADNIISVNSLTKIYGLFALKCGWLIAPAKLARAIRAAAPDGDYGMSKLAHAVAAHVLEQRETFDSHWRRIVASARPVMERHAQAMIDARLIEGEFPEFGCMYFPKVVGVSDTRALARTLWNRYGLLVAPGEYFGQPGHIRIGFGRDGAELGLGLERLQLALEAIRNSGR